jgi:hypothetical protein
MGVVPAPANRLLLFLFPYIADELLIAAPARARDGVCAMAWAS